MQHPDTYTHTLDDGRTLAYCEYGDPDGDPIFYAHGSPGSRYEAILFDEAARNQNFRIIATDRPGMGASTFKPDRRLLDYPQDIAALADALSIDRFGVMGWSGGGAHTVVCAYALADRLTFTTVLCGYTSFIELPNAVDLLEAPADRMAVGLSKNRPFLFRLLFEVMGVGIKLVPNLMMKEALKTANTTDADILSDPSFVENLITDQKEAFRQGAKGATIDAAVHYVDWGFRLADIPGKVYIFHGTEDRLVPFEYGQHLAATIPDAKLYTLKGQGHLFPANHQTIIFLTARLELSGNDSKMAS